MSALEAPSIQPLVPVTVQCTMMEPCVTVSLSVECHFSKQCSTGNLCMKDTLRQIYLFFVKSLSSLGGSKRIKQ